MRFSWGTKHKNKQMKTQTAIYSAMIRERLKCAALRSHLKSELFSVVKEHQDGHLEGGDLQDVLSGVRTGHLGSSYAHF